jgi:hypothetical protein
MSVTPEALQELLDELERSKASRKRAWDNLQEIRWVLKDTPGLDLEPLLESIIGFYDKRISQCCCSFSGVYLLFVRTGERSGKGVN